MLFRLTVKHHFSLQTITLDNVPYLFQSHPMDWKRAIAINREALTRIVAGLVALVRLQNGAVTRLPRPVYQHIALALHKTESAVRRLIFIAAQGLIVPQPERRAMPPGLVIVGQGSGRMAFQLYDTRKHFDDNDEANTQPTSGPRIRVVGEADPRALFLAKFRAPASNLCSEAETMRLNRRLDAVECALDHLPRQAKRMAQWLKRRELARTPKFTSPIRPGPPPGHRKEPKDDIDAVLKECHGLAWDVLRADTS
jgi:hypothetical protein